MRLNRPILPRDTPEPDKKPAATRNIVLAGVMVAMILAALDSSIVNTALPRMAATLGGLTHLSWVVTAFMLSSTITSPLYGKLSDTFGRRAMFGVSISIFLAGSALCGLSQTMDELIGFRALQGLGAGGLLVLSQAAVGDVLSPRERPRYQGLFSGAFGLAGVGGPLLGGIITQALSWRWIFYVNLPIGGVAFAMIWLGLKQLNVQAPPGRERHIDIAGAGLLAGLTAALLILLAGGGNEFAWISFATLGLGLFSLLCLGLFILREAVAPDPLIRLTLFRNPVFTRGSIVGGMVMFAMLGAMVFMPLYFQVVLGMSPAESGAMILPQVSCMLLSSVLGGRIVSRIGRLRGFLLTGIGLEMVSLAALAVFAMFDAPPLLFLLVLGTLGTGMGMGMPNLTNAVQNSVDHAELGAATGAMVFIRSLGGAVGVAASGAIMSARLASARHGFYFHALSTQGIHTLVGLSPAQHAAIASTYRTALTGSFIVTAGVMIAAFIIVLGMPEIRLRGHIEGKA